MRSIPDVTLNDGQTMPQLGFGCWSLSQEETTPAILSAFKLGYRLIDGAFIYGNEAQMGEALRASGLNRDEVFLTTKVWNADHGSAKTRASVERSLKTIGVDQLNLVLIHWPAPMKDLYVETWQTLIDLKKEGLIRSIGVSNFNADHLERIIDETGEVPVLNQIEINPGLQQNALRAACAAKGVVVQAWTPLGKGRSFDAAPIRDAAERSGKSPAQVILRWHMQLGNATIPRSANPARQADNLNIFDFELTADEMAAIATLDEGFRTGPDPSVFGAD
ncbi:MAG: aldo/keto reductase [Rhizobiaceae bacterium]|nr:aldo/keto reductase [Rhizobiaceae bacterium]